jgi:hypothetical protein
VRDADVLAVSLDDLDQRNWDLNSYLITKKHLPDSVVMSLVAADRLRGAPQPVASSEFRERLRHRLATQIQTDAIDRVQERKPSVWRRVIQLLAGSMVAPIAVAVVAFAGAGVLTASSAARPSTALYPVKVGLERLQLAAAMTPTEKIGIRLQIATSRLTEASAETRIGDLMGATRLLREFDVELAAAQADVVRGGVPTQASPVVLSVDRQMAVLESERNRIAGRSIEPSVAPTTSVSRVPIVADPAKLGSGSVASTNTTVSSASASNAVSNDANVLMPSSTAVAASSVTQPARVADSVSGAPLSQSSQLVFLLLTQVREGDGDAALATAWQYGTVLEWISPSDDGAADALRAERASLVLARVDAPYSARSALDLALSYVDDALAIRWSAIPSVSSPTRRHQA